MTQGSSPCPLDLLYWQASSLPLSHLGSPIHMYTHTHTHTHKHTHTQFVFEIKQYILRNNEKFFFFFFVGLHVYFNHQVFFYTLTKALIRGFTFSAPPHPVIVSLLPFKQSSCFSNSLRIMFTCDYIVTHAYVWAAYHIPHFISYLSNSCLPLVS